MESFGVALERGQDMIRSEIHLDLEEGEDLINELRQLGLPFPRFDSN